jgi:Lrp/AsnC family transcriptional regulator, regulator of ectoine-degradation genes
MTATKRPPALDRIDIKVLAGLQRNGRSTIQELAKHVGLSPRATLERVRRLETAGIITGYQAVIDIARLARPVTVFAEIALVKQANQGHFERQLAALEELVECWEVSGAVDYIARFMCADLAVYEALTARLIDELGVARIVSHVALRPVRRFAGYPESLFAQNPA